MSRNLGQFYKVKTGFTGFLHWGSLVCVGMEESACFVQNVSSTNSHVSQMSNVFEGVIKHQLLNLAQHAQTNPLLRFELCSGARPLRSLFGPVMSRSVVINGGRASDLLLNCHLICIVVQINDLSNERSFFTRSLGAP